MTGDDMNGITPAELKSMDESALDALCSQLRGTLLAYGRAHGGHIGSNLGMVEVTVALHRVFDSPRDALIFDVSHQSYVHKMLTGRWNAYTDAAHFDEVTGFTNPEESEHDRFVLGHTGTSISLACGVAKTRDLQQAETGSSPTGNVVAVIGDGALSSAVAFEGLNNAASQGGNLIIILNDNEMSIAHNVGGMYGTLDNLRRTQGTYEPNLFRAFGLDYRYIESGNDVHALIRAFQEVKDIDHPIILHIHTCKGLGLDEIDAQDGFLPGQCEANHWRAPISARQQPLGARKYYGQLAMQYLLHRFASDPGLTVISPATPGSNGITPEFRKLAGRHYVDTGITEEHAVAFAAGITQAGGTPVLATSATFFQRAYDQLQQELALNAQPTTLLVFSAGLSSADNTHSGAFDIAMLGNIPGMTYLTPSNERELLTMLDWSTRSRDHGAVAIRIPSQAVLDEDMASGRSRYPSLELADEIAADSAMTVSSKAGRSAGSSTGTMRLTPPSPFDEYVVEHMGSEVAIIGLGNTMPIARKAGSLLMERTGVEASIVKALQCTSIDTETLTNISANTKVVVTLEDGQREGGWGETIASWISGNADPTINAMHAVAIGADKEFTDRVPLSTLQERYGLTPEHIVQRIASALSDNR